MDTIRDNLTKQEELAIETLIAYGKARDPWREPIHAVDRVLNTTTDRSKELVSHLVKRGFITPATDARDAGQHTEPTEWWWEKPGLSFKDQDLIQDIAISKDKYFTSDPQILDQLYQLKAKGVVDSFPGPENPDDPNRPIIWRRSKRQ